MTVLLLILMLAVFDAAEAARLTFPMESRKVKLPPVDANGIRYVRNPLAALDRRLGAKSSLYSGENLCLGSEKSFFLYSHSGGDQLFWLYYQLYSHLMPGA